ncbi:SIR2 family protein [Brucella gallinifaecis]|uniref:SIR2 family protein n=1 Tax=Brucella gallinifaecis TaxID=215590 RepID=UPI002361EBB2|nr:SIR2 family protein [Brucella gallinifaecis]
MSINDIKVSAEQKRLVVVFGAGASIALTPKSRKALAWKTLVQSALDHSFKRGLLGKEQLDRNIAALASNDIDDLLGVAEFTSRKLQAPSGQHYARWMQDEFRHWKPEDGGMVNALRSLEARRLPIATLNYDTMVETATGLSAIDFSDKKSVMEWARGEVGGVLHLHGVWTNPPGCVFGIRDYHEALTDQTRDLLQRYLSTMNRLLFVGCGDTFSDPNFTNLIHWLRTNMGSSMPRHYALVRESEVQSKLSDPAWRDFVEPLSYGANYDDLPGFLLRCFPTLEASTKPTRQSKAAAGKASHVLDAYRNFLIRDCGEMTIEGVRADIDTAGRKFNLEKLFVPIETLAVPPAISKLDPQSETKLEKWKQDNKEPIPFAQLFATKKRISLLALPGGGKTLLLKRLAVAYSSKTRRVAGDDNLPDLDLIPLIIRCREWKEHIRKPIQSMIKSLADIVGDASLDGLLEAFETPLKSGNVLLLLDGLDEIHDDGDRLVFVDNLEKFITAYPDIRVVITSREAGFDLVAPTLGRFCDKYRISPLNEEAIISLCNHWHNLMSSSVKEAQEEAQQTASQVLSSNSLRRLAENPLLLTMLLVVKHGAGKLPPDRVSLYERAVEILLDSWNIKGHAALNPKEAVPQLSCLAFEMLRQGKQTATEQEIVDIITDAREKLPLIGRYAKDSPDEFLKRVELRSSLLLEGGHRLEDGKAVPFYQFRHLTFQEYLAAAAVVNGQMVSVDPSSSPVVSFGDNLLSSEWKEVVPMTAVLLGRRSQPLIEHLLRLALKEISKPSRKNEDVNDAMTSNGRRPASNRLLQAMVEEAEFSPSIVQESANVVVALLQGSHGQDSIIRSLARGPYSPELLKACLEFVVQNPAGPQWEAISNAALFFANSKDGDYWTNDSFLPEILNSLQSNDDTEVLGSILGIGGAFITHRRDSTVTNDRRIYDLLETQLKRTSWLGRHSAAWAWGYWRHLNFSKSSSLPVPDDMTIACLIDGFFQDSGAETSTFAAASSTLYGVGRNSVNYELTPKQKGMLRKRASQRSYLDGATRLAFIINGVFSDAQLRTKIKSIPENTIRYQENIDILEALGIELSNSTSRKPSTVGKRRKNTTS